MSILICDETLSKVIKEQSLHLNNNECVDAMKEDATVNLQKLIRTSDLLRRMEKSKVLTDDHVKRGAKLLGYESDTPFNNINLDSLTINDREKLYYQAYEEVDLFDKAHEAAAIEETVEPPLSLQVATQAECCSSSDELPPSLYRYLSLLVQQLVSPDRQLRLEALDEISSSQRVSLVLPFLLQFVEARLRENTLLASNTITLLNCYVRVVNNDKVYIEPYIANILDVNYSLCCDWTSSRESTNDPIKIIELSSDLAANIILRFSRYNSKQFQFYEKYTKFCKETIESDELSLSALGSLTLLTKLGPVCIHDVVLPLISELYKDIFETSSTITTTDSTVVHIRRIIKLSVFSLYNVMYKTIHCDKMSALLDEFNKNHIPFHVDQQNCSKVSPTTSSPHLPTYQTIYGVLGETMSLVGPDWPVMEGKQPLILSKKMTKELKKRLTETFQMFASVKGKTLPVERQMFLRKQAIKQIKSNQVYNLHNAMAPLQYFL